MRVGYDIAFIMIPALIGIRVLVVESIYLKPKTKKTRSLGTLNLFHANSYYADSNQQQVRGLIMLVWYTSRLLSLDRCTDTIIRESHVRLCTLTKG